MTNKKLILIIEDDPALSKMYKLKLEKEGFAATIAADGESGIRSALEKKPDLILLDILLPKVDGLVVLSQLKQINELSQIPVIALSNLTEREKAEKAYQTGVKEYLAKAMHTPEEVVEKIKRNL